MNDRVKNGIKRDTYLRVAQRWPRLCSPRDATLINSSNNSPGWMFTEASTTTPLRSSADLPPVRTWAPLFPHLSRREHGSSRYVRPPAPTVLQPLPATSSYHQQGETTARQAPRTPLLGAHHELGLPPSKVRWSHIHYTPQPTRLHRRPRAVRDREMKKK